MQKSIMEKTLLAISLIFSVLMYGQPDWISNVGAKSFPGKEFTFSINDFGAFIFCIPHKLQLMD